MPYVRDSFWSGRQFTSLEHMQAEALLWATNVAGQRQSRPLGGAKPLSVFEAVEAEALLPLPETPFVLARWSTALVGPDIHVKAGRTLAPGDWYPLFPNPVVAESLLDRLINASHQVIMNGPGYRPTKRPRNLADKPTKSPLE